jgi:uncharacterized membrane protein
MSCRGDGKAPKEEGGKESVGPRCESIVASTQYRGISGGSGGTRLLPRLQSYGLQATYQPFTQLVHLEPKVSCSSAPRSLRSQALPFPLSLLPPLTSSYIMLFVSALLALAASSAVVAQNATANSTLPGVASVPACAVSSSCPPSRVPS